MLLEQTIRKLNEMRLHKMAETLRKINDGSEYANLSFDEKIGIMVDCEWINRHNNKITRLTRAAKFSIPEACIENIRFSPERNLDKGMILKLSLCTYIQESRNVIILGATGTGKSYLSCAFGHSAINSFYSVKYIRLPDLFIELDEARAVGKYKKVLRQYQLVNLLILDEWLTFSITTENARDLLEIMDRRYNHASTIFCTQFDVPGWFQKIGEPTYADAICDRIIHNAYIIKISGDSMRKILVDPTEGSMK